MNDFSIQTSEDPTARVERIINAAQTLQKMNGWSNAEVARRSEIAGATYSEFINWRYKGNLQKICDKLSAWIAAEEHAFETRSAQLADIGFVETSCSRKVITALKFAQSRPCMVTITLGSGLGKTMTLNWFAANNPHATRVVIEPVEGKPRPAIRKIAAAYGIYGHTTAVLMSHLKDRIRREGGRQPLLMIDEAQNLTDEAVNQLRFLLDECGCGLALSGNQDLMTRYAVGATREGYGQIHRRIFMRVYIKVAPKADIDLLLDRLDITDAKARQYGHHIAQRPGGFGQMVDTLQLASLNAYSHGRLLSADDVREAWGNRSNEELR